MDKKAISEIRKLIKPDSCVDRIRGCYVNEEGQVIRELHDSLASMEKESLEKSCAAPCPGSSAETFSIWNSRSSGRRKAMASRCCTGCSSRNLRTTLF